MRCSRACARRLVDPLRGHRALPRQLVGQLGGRQQRAVVGRDEAGQVVQRLQHRALAVAARALAAGVLDEEGCTFFWNSGP